MVHYIFPRPKLSYLGIIVYFLGHKALLSMVNCKFPRPLSSVIYGSLYIPQPKLSYLGIIVNFLGHTALLSMVHYIFPRP